jgi:tRNA A-37 threonylcarbamoyl transferase component Bud32
MKTCPQCKMRYPNEAVYCFVDGADLVPLRDPRIGTTVAGRYIIEEVIGEGGMATVYRATQKLTERVVAMKIMNAALAREAVVRERFRREAKNAQKLSHPNIIEIFDQGETEDGTAYIVMELLKGRSLAEVVSKGPLEIHRALLLMIQTARGIARAHDLDVIHRDLKPENIFLVQVDEGVELVKLLDFGIALSKQDSRLTGAGEIFGTPQYMAPERITAGEPGPAADLYSLGVVFFEMLTGQLPFDAPDIATFFNKHLKEPPRSPRSLNNLVPVPLEDLVLRLLAKDPKARPVDSHRVHADLLEMARDADVAIPSVPESEAEAERTIRNVRPRPAPRVAVERWARRMQVFQQMLGQSYGASPPREMQGLLQRIGELVPRIVAMRAASVDEQRVLGTIEEKGREGRQRFGFAVDALGLDTSKAKDEVRVVEAHCATVHERTEQAKARFVAAHNEILRWEGRSGFQEPHPDLALAYRQAATIVDGWVKAREDERKSVALREGNERAVTDLEYQIQALRAALATHEREIEVERGVCEKQMIKLGKQADQLEAELLGLATRFCEPLRARPELSPFFEQLEADVAA